MIIILEPGTSSAAGSVELPAETDRLDRKRGLYSFDSAD